MREITSWQRQAAGVCSRRLMFLAGHATKQPMIVIMAEAELDTIMPSYERKKWYCYRTINNTCKKNKIITHYLIVCYILTDSIRKIGIDNRTGMIIMYAFHWGMCWSHRLRQWTGSLCRWKASVPSLKGCVYEMTCRPGGKSWRWVRLSCLKMIQSMAGKNSNQGNVKENCRLWNWRFAWALIIIRVISGIETAKKTLLHPASREEG